MAYRALEAAVGYDKMPEEVRRRLVRSCRQQTWYVLGWDKLCAEQERFLASLPAGEHTAPDLLELLRTYALLAQREWAYVTKAEEFAESIANRFDQQAAADAIEKLADIYGQRGLTDRAAALHRRVIEDWPESAGARRAEVLISPPSTSPSEGSASSRAGT
jgi:hypothetical protein